MVGHLDQVKGKHIESADACLAGMKRLIGPEEGWSDHVMRVVELAPSGFTPRHSHDWEHINYVVEGEGTLFLEGEHHPLREGSFAFVPKNALHQFSNSGNRTFKFICIVPKKGHQ